MWLAAVLASGLDAVLSHGSAADLWGVQRSATRKRIDVAIQRSSRSTPRIRRHQVGLRADEVTLRSRIPVTTLARTIFDLSAETSVEGLEATIRQAEYLHRFRLYDLQRMLKRHPHRRGATASRHAWNGSRAVPMAAAGAGSRTGSQPYSRALSCPSLTSTCSAAAGRRLARDSGDVATAGRPKDPARGSSTTPQPVETAVSRDIDGKLQARPMYVITYRRGSFRTSACSR